MHQKTLSFHENERMLLFQTFNQSHKQNNDGLVQERSDSSALAKGLL